MYGIKYLRFIAGEKHLIYVTAMGIRKPMPGTLESAQAQPWEDLDRVGATASDGRVALHVIQTGGLPAAPAPFLAPMPVMRPLLSAPGQAQFGMPSSGNPGTGSGARSLSPTPGWDRPAPDPSVPIPGMDAAGLEALSGLRELAHATGGYASIMSDAMKAVDRIDTETRVAYLLAYQPLNAVSDGRYRSVRVEVNRPGVTVLYRHGYHAEPQGGSLTRRATIADSRLIAAASSTRAMRDIGVVAAPTFAKNAKGKGGELLLQMTIETARLTWATDDLSRRVAHLDLAVYCGASGNKVVGQTRRTLDVAMTEARFQQATTRGLPYTVRIPVTARPQFFKIVVSDYEADRLGSTVTRMK